MVSTTSTDNIARTTKTSFQSCNFYRMILKLSKINNFLSLFWFPFFSLKYNVLSKFSPKLLKYKYRTPNLNIFYQISIYTICKYLSEFYFFLLTVHMMNCASMDFVCSESPLIHIPTAPNIIR